MGIEVDMHYLEFLHFIESNIRNIVRDCYPHTWDENHISFSLVQGVLGRNHVVEVFGLDRPFKLVWDFKKLRTPTETDCGDIGVLVHLTTWSDETIEGVGLLEAKKRGVGKNNFPATNKTQLKRILKTSRASQILLYDYENVNSCMDNLAYFHSEEYHEFRNYRSLNNTQAVAVPAQIVLQVGKYNTNLHKFGVPLSYQLLYRYFRGFDLEMDVSIVQKVKGNMGKHGGCRNLLVVGVSTGGGDPQLPVVSDNTYESIG